MSIQIDMSDRDQVLPSWPGTYSPGEPDEQLRSLLAVVEPGFFGWSGAGTGDVVQTSRNDGPGTRELELLVRVPAMRAEVASALVRALQARRRFHGVSFVRVRSTGSRAEPIASLDCGPVAPRLPFELIEHYNEGTEAFTALVDLCDPLTNDVKAQLTRLTHHYAALLAHGALVSDLYPGSDGRLEQAEDPLPNQWAIEVRDYHGSRAAWDPLLEGLAVLHQRLPVQRVEVWG